MYLRIFVVLTALFATVSSRRLTADLPQLTGEPLRPKGPGALDRPYRILQSNDDGWINPNIREFYKSLKDAGAESLICATAQDESGAGDKDEKPKKVGDDGCLWASCPPGSPAVGEDENDPNITAGHTNKQNWFNHMLTYFQYVNAPPVTAVKYGIEELSSRVFGSKPDIVVVGINDEDNVGHDDAKHSGTIQAARKAGSMGVPSIAFSGMTSSGVHSPIYAEIATNVTMAVLDSGTPYLPENTFLSVNYPAVNDIQCNDASKFKFTLARLHNKYENVVSGSDMELCGNWQLPVDEVVIKNDGCYASIGIAKVDDGHTAERKEQLDVAKRLQSILTCPRAMWYAGEVVSDDPVRNVNCKEGDCK